MVVYELHSPDEFNARLQEAGDKLVVVDFGATWCGPCQAMTKEFSAFSDEFTDMIFCSIDVDEVEDVAQSKGVTALPTFMIFKHGEEEERIVGARKDKLKDTIKKVRAKHCGAPGCGDQCQQPM